jgi:hypothetical protein
MKRLYLLLWEFACRSCESAFLDSRWTGPPIVVGGLGRKLGAERRNCIRFMECTGHPAFSILFHDVIASDASASPATTCVANTE